MSNLKEKEGITEATQKLIKAISLQDYPNIYSALLEGAELNKKIGEKTVSQLLKEAITEWKKRIEEDLEVAKDGISEIIKMLQEKTTEGKAWNLYITMQEVRFASQRILELAWIVAIEEKLNQIEKKQFNSIRK